MQAIIVDDEPLALQRLERLLKEFNGIKIVKTFQDPRKALQFVSNQEIDIVFLDIDMPEVNGMMLADKLLHKKPDISLVFVTAYNEYAVEAFELNALDYLLKPVQKERLAKTLSRMLKGEQKPKIKQEVIETKMLCLFQHISYTNPSIGTKKISWRTMKAQELFAYLVQNRGRTVHREALIDLLWPNSDLEKAIPHLHTTIYQIRSTIKKHGLAIRISYMDEGYRIEMGGTKLDIEEWEAGVRTLPRVSLETIDQHQALMKLYRGDYLAEHLYIWAEGERERLLFIWLEHAKQVASFFVQNEQYTEAILIYKQIQAKNPYLEDGYLGLMKVNAILGYQSKVIKEYQALMDRFHFDLGIDPRKEVIIWYRDWLKSI